MLYIFPCIFNSNSSFAKFLAFVSLSFNSLFLIAANSRILARCANCSGVNIRFLFGSSLTGSSSTSLIGSSTTFFTVF